MTTTVGEPVRQDSTPPIKWSGRTSSYHHKHSNTPNPEDTDHGFRKVWMLDAQWSTCPIEVEDEVRKMWRNYELGNDRYIIKTSLEDLSDGRAPACAQWVREQAPDIDEDEMIIIHWWW